MNEENTSALAAYLENRALGYGLIVVGVVFCLIGVLLLPDLSEPATRETYEPFFTAAGALSAGLFVTLAVASKQVTSDVVLGSLTVLFVGGAALAAVLLLLPSACTAVYSVAFVLLVGGGISGLISTAGIAAAALMAARTETEGKILTSLQELRDGKPPSKS